MRQAPRFRVERVLNNNVVIVRSEMGEEEIWLGRSLGFGTRPGAYLHSDDPRLERRFRSAEGHPSEPLPPASRPTAWDQDAADMEDWLRPLLPPEVTHADSLRALATHARGAVDRLRAGIPIDNPFMGEVRLLYPDTWQVAERIARALTVRYRVVLPDEEVAFLTLHVQALLKRGARKSMMESIRAAERALKLLTARAPQLLETDGLHIRRLRTELRRAFERMLNGERLSGLAVDRVEAEATAWLGLAEEMLRAGLPTAAPDRMERAHLALWLARMGALANARPPTVEPP